MIDVAVVCRKNGNELKQYYPLICSKIDLLEQRWGKLKSKYFEEVTQLKIFEVGKILPLIEIKTFVKRRHTPCCEDIMQR